MNNLEIFDLIASHQNKYRKLYKSDNNDIIERYIENSTNIMKNALLQMQLKEIHKEIVIIQVSIYCLLQSLCSYVYYAAQVFFVLLSHCVCLWYKTESI